MKRFICSAAIASALLAAATDSSRASTFDIFYNGSITSSASVTQDWTLDLTAAGTVTVNSGHYFDTSPFSISFASFHSPAPTISYAAPSFSCTANCVLSLAAGAYDFTVTGNGSASSFYGGSFTYSGTGAAGSATVAPTPIPGALALFATGLGLLGFWAWTKGRKSSSAPLEAVAC